MGLRVRKSWSLRTSSDDDESVPFAEERPAQATESNVSSEEEEEEEHEEPASAYTTLLQTLQATNESFAKAYAPRYLDV